MLEFCKTFYLLSLVIKHIHTNKENNLPLFLQSVTVKNKSSLSLQCIMLVL